MSIRQREEELLIAYLARFKRFVYKANASSWPDVSRVIVLHRGFRPALRQSLKESSDTLFSLLYSKYVKLVQRLNRHSHRLIQNPPVQNLPVQNLPVQNPPVQKLAQKPIAAYKPMDVNL